MEVAVLGPCGLSGCIRSQEVPTTGEASRSPKWRMHTFYCQQCR